LGIALDKLHGLEPHEVMQVLEPGQRRWPRPGSSNTTGVRVLTIWGRTRAGRPLIVALRHQQGLDWLIVGARTMQPKELDEFEEWEARGEQ
jgi:hypothetical protein